MIEKCPSCGGEVKIHNENNDEFNTIWMCNNCHSWDIVGDECDVSHCEILDEGCCIVCGKKLEE